MERDSIITPLTVPIEEIIKPSDACTFLAGAGISMDPPSNLPSAREICRVLLELCTPADEVENLLGLQALRYELIVEELQKYIDKDIKFMDYFEIVMNPNLIHQFLARAINRRHHVVTTNFDYLIERAMMAVLPGDKQSVICPIITRRDYDQQADIQALLDTGMLPVYKIHGSRKNIVTGEDTRTSMVTTISALGRDRAEGETFAIEPYKKPAVEGIMKDRVLVVMGYSGSDDFDIGPVLKELPHLRRLIWVDHVQGDTMEAFEIKKEPRFRDARGLSKVEALLAEIRHDVDFSVVLVRSKTTRFVTDVLCRALLAGDDIHHVQSTELTVPQQPRFRDWVVQFYGGTTSFNKHLLAAILFEDLRQFKSCIRVAEKGLVLATKDGTAYERGHFLNALAVAFEAIGRYDEALKYHEESLKIDIETGNRDGEATSNSGIGFIYYSRGNYSEAISHFEKAIEINKAQDVKKSTSGTIAYSAKTGHYINNLAMSYKDIGQNDKALSLIEEAMKIANQNGDLDAKAKYISNMAQVFKIRGEYQRALASFEEALRIDEQLGNIKGIAARCSFIGGIYFAQNNWEKAKGYFDRNLAISDQIGDISGRGTALANLAAIAIARNELDKALPLLQEALAAAEKTKASKFIASRHAKIAQVHHKRKDYPNAIKEFQIAIDIDRQLNVLDSLAIDLNNLALVHSDAGDHAKALSLYKESYAISSKTGNKEVADAALLNAREKIKEIGKIHETKKEYGKAIELYTAAMKEEIDRGEKKHEAVFLFWIGRTQYKADENAKAKETLLHATTIHEAISNEQGISDCAYYLGLIEAEGGQHGAAIPQFARSMAIEARLGKQEDQGLLLKKISASIANLDAQQAAAVPRSLLDATTDIATKADDTEAAIEYLSTVSEFFEKNKIVDAALDTYSAGIAVARRCNDKKALQQLLVKAGTLRRDKQDFQGAINMLDESLKIVTEIGDAKAIAHRQSNIGMVHYKAKNNELADTYFTKAKELFQSLGDENNAKIASSNADAARKAMKKK